MSATVLRRVQIAVVIVGAVVTVMMAVLVAGCYRDDAAIDAHTGTATADVVTAGSFKSTVRFYTPDGDLRSPRLGIFYPTELSAGQRISVEYDTGDPELVRVAGRDASLSLLPAASIVGFTWLGVGAVMIVLAEVRRRWPVDRGDAPTAAAGLSEV